MDTRFDEFFATARERQSIFLRRAAGMPRPWTEDPVLHRYPITNVFREQDKTTKWLRENVRSRYAGKPELLLATVVFRWFNRISTGEAIFMQKFMDLSMGVTDGTAFEHFLASGDTLFLKSAIKAYCQDGPYCTGAYMITSPQGFNKLDGMCEVIRRFCANSTKHGWEWRAMAQYMLDCRSQANAVSLYEAWVWLKEFEFQGPFHAYEVITDLRHTALLDTAPDIMTWANPGPGAQRGLNRIHGRRKAPAEGQTARRALRVPIKAEQAQTEMQELLTASLDPMHWPQPDSKNVFYEGPGYGSLFMHKLAPAQEQWPPWEMRDVEMWLCEYDKIIRTRSGDGKPRGVYGR